ncbi:MAG: cell wall anchor protein [Opitutaceae bacterium]|jgi:hypothetical protein|nr:cell wall anchor protein [Opitutaceae bacterium]
MQTITKFFTRLAFIASVALLLSASRLHAVVVTDPLLTTGSGSMNKDTGSIGITEIAAGSTAQSILEATAGFAVVKAGFATFEKYNAGASTNTFSFTASTRPDVRFSIASDSTSVNADAGREMTNPGYLATSSGWRLINGGGTGYVKGIIEFGSQDSDTFTADEGVGVAAVGFLLTAPNANDIFTRSPSVTTVFKSTTGVILSTQTVSGLSASSHGLYFGYKTTGDTLIGSVEISVTVTALSGKTATFSLNNFGFAPAGVAVPEPAHAALLIGFGIAAIIVCRACRHSR